MTPGKVAYPPPRLMPHTRPCLFACVPSATTLRMPDSRCIDSTTKAGYFPGSSPIRVKMIAERRSGRLLGAQVVGREASAKRIDTLAVCIWNEMGVDEVLSLDLSYAPPFSPVWDPVLITARKAFDAVEADAVKL